MINDQESTYDVLSLQMTDEQIADKIGSRIRDGEAFWNKELALDEVRKENRMYWLAQDDDYKNLQGHQVPYYDPRISISVETLIPMVTSKPPQPVVIQAFDTESSHELSERLQDVLLAKYEDCYLMGKFMMVTRHLLMGQRIGVMKYYWDDSIGEYDQKGKAKGDIGVKVIQPHKIVFDAEADDKSDIPLLAEVQNFSLEELAEKYPDKKDALTKEAGAEAGVKTDVSKRLNTYETHFCYHDKSGNKVEAIAWKYKSVIMDSMKTPLWNYEETDLDEEGNYVPNNFLSKPTKPYVFFNHVNSGKFILDDNSLMDMARNQQDILNKRGRQIVENADQANSGMVYDVESIKPSTMSKLMGDPNEKIGVKGDVRKALMRIPPNQLAQYVVADKQDARQQIDNIFGVHAPIRGEGENAPTLGQEVLSQRADMTRTRTLASSLEDGADQLYKGMVQLMKVFYDDKRTIRFTGTEGQTSFIPISKDSIEPGIVVRVKSGSLLPDDEVSRAQRTMSMAAVLDPLTLAEGVGEKNPREVATRIMLYRMAPDRYMSDVLQEDPQGNQADPSALQEQDFITQGQEVPPQQNPTKAHLATHDQWLNSPEFGQLSPEIQQAGLAHVKAEIENSKTALGQGEEPQEEVQEEMPPKEFDLEEQQSPGLLSRLFGGG